MEQNKSPFEEIFKREKKKKPEEKKEGILDALDNEEKSLFEESSGGALDIEAEGEGSVSAEVRYRNLLNSLVKKRFFEEAMKIIGEMKEEFRK